ncbi:hypothetical protein Rta_20390 [Ramlibacter tataouinensis TTB310]|uniref:Rhodanese domain-containing protein n=1 Tax=Ramlibacter tataouinensis (strain ATCC BAA-407 / DSM 14655 / LMG 21543 / TTB310) TaxID=365046 RepID=F5XYF6_RAMTT|nr:hypothetical protein Rta_20390 [Ramlibacter tataouinensis TTB310]
MATASLAVAATSAAAELKLMVATDPSGSRELLTARYHDIAISLQAVLGQPVRVERSTVFAEVLRSTRTAEFDIYIVPPHVAASALAHKYELVGVTGKPETFVLVARPGIGSVAQLAQRKIHLAQQDSLYAYMAKGLLNESGGSLTAAKEVRYERTSGAGLVAVQLGLFDATVTRKAEYDEWIKTQNGNKAEVLIESKPVPGGLTLVVNKSMPENLRQKLTAWAAGNAPMDLGLGRMQATSDKAMYQYVGGLGHFTPLQLPGVTRVTAQQAAELMRQGAQMVDVRSEKEFNARRIPGAVLASYIEKSAKDTTFNASLDDFSAVDALDKNRPVIFACNGAECWKSYKASKTAVARGFKTVYWLRGGLPEWEELNFQTARN